MQKLARYWATEYDWRKCEAQLNALPHFITEIDGLDIHFIHVRSKHENALPLIVTHGWPGSIIEQLKIIEPLTNPTAHGGSAADAFHVVIPSMPGYGFSGKPTTTGWDPERIARLGVLMKRLGYTGTSRKAAIGARSSSIRWRAGASGLLGIHTNMPGVVPPTTTKRRSTHRRAAAVRAFRRRKRAYETAGDFYKTAWPTPRWGRPARRRCTELRIHPSAWPPGCSTTTRAATLIARAFDGQPKGLTRDDVLDNITLYWLTNTADLRGPLYWENKLDFFAPKGVTIPVAVSVFPDELYQAPRSWAEQAYPTSSTTTSSTRQTRGLGATRPFR